MKTPQKSYAAFLRGINIGPHKKVAMKLLEKSFQSLGFTNVKTLLNSGNVVFQSDQSLADLNKIIAPKLQKDFGFEIPVILRSLKDLQALENANPFQGIKVTSATRLYVTFLGAKPQTKLKVPHVSTDGNLQILSATDSEVCTFVTLTAGLNTTDMMKIIEKQYGKNITTRNWNTIQKILKIS